MKQGQVKIEIDAKEFYKKNPDILIEHILEVKLNVFEKWILKTILKNK